MIEFLDLFFSVISFFATIIILMMTTRSIMSMLFDESEIDNKFYNVIVNITEVVIVPVRYIFRRLNWFQDTPIDVSFLVAFIVLSLFTVMA